MMAWWIFTNRNAPVPTRCALLPTALGLFYWTLASLQQARDALRQLATVLSSSFNLIGLHEVSHGLQALAQVLEQVSR